MIPLNRVTFSNRIDIGIFLLFLELCLPHEKIGFKRALYDDFGVEDAEKTLVAVYSILINSMPVPEKEDYSSPVL